MQVHGGGETRFPKPFFDSIGKLIGLAATIIGVVGGILAIYDRVTRPYLELELLIPITGWEVSLRNSGRTSAKEVRIGVIAWRNSSGAPAPDVRKSYGIHNLAPGAAAAVPIEVVADSNDPEYRIYRAKLSTSGYIVATCESCTTPRAGASYIPGSEEPWGRNGLSTDRAAGPVRSLTTHIGRRSCMTVFDHPRGVCARETGPRWNPESGSQRHDGVLPTPPGMPD